MAAAILHYGALRHASSFTTRHYAMLVVMPLSPAAAADAYAMMFTATLLPC